MKANFHEIIMYLCIHRTTLYKLNMWITMMHCSSGNATPQSSLIVLEIPLLTLNNKIWMKFLEKFAQGFECSQ